MNQARRIASGVLVLSVISGAAISSLRGTTVRNANLRDLVEQSDRIFVGRCVSKESDTTTSVPFTRYTFEVVDRVKGVTGKTVTVRQLGLTEPIALGNGLQQVARMPGMPVYEPGREVLLFLVQESPIGLSSPIGLGQGAFRVVGYGDTRTLVNEVGNRNVGHDLPASWLRARGVAEDRARKLAGSKGRPLDYEEFLQTLRKVAVPR